MPTRRMYASEENVCQRGECMPMRRMYASKENVCQQGECMPARRTWHPSKKSLVVYRFSRWSEERAGLSPPPGKKKEAVAEKKHQSVRV